MAQKSRERVGMMASVLSNEQIAWLAEVDRQIQSTASFKAGWDGYRSQAIKPEYLAKLSEVLHRLQSIAVVSSLPNIIGNSNGSGVRAEWYKERWEIDIWVEEGGITVLVSDRYQQTEGWGLENLANLTDANLIAIASYLS